MIKQTFFLLLLIISGLAYAKTDTAIFAGGCFWCLQADFDKVPGVIETLAGYDGGESKNPTYEKVSSGSTRYAESVEVKFDPDKVSYPQLLVYFWHHIDPTVKDAQFCDHGKQYRSAIFYLNATQQQQALASLAEVKKQLPAVFTEIVASTHFYPAEEYHQKYYQKNPIRYKFYRLHCGRDARIGEIWHVKS